MAWTAVTLLGLNVVVAVVTAHIHVRGVTDAIHLAVAALGVLSAPLVVIAARRSRATNRALHTTAAELDRRIAGEAAELAVIEQVRRRIEQVVASQLPMEMHFQPIVDLGSGMVVGHEALARFPEGSPDQWFADAARVGLGTDLEVAAIRGAIGAISHLSGYVSINASPDTLLAPAFWDALESVDGRRLVVELTEHVQVEEYSRYAAALAKLRRLGIRLAIDDAGAGHSSLRHIVHMAPAIIKLDSSLTAMIDVDPVRGSLVTALTAFALAIDATVVAEGIERAEEARAVTAMGVACGQGWLYARAMPLAQAQSRPVVDLRSDTAAPVVSTI